MYKVLMAPDAPAPVYNSQGREMRPWEVRLAYDATLDEYVVHWSSPSTRTYKGQQLRLSYGPEEVDEAIGQVCRLVRTAAAPRLF